MESNSQNAQRVRPNLRCVNLDAENWSKLKELSTIQQRSISSYIRFFVGNEYKKLVKKNNFALVE